MMPSGHDIYKFVRSARKYGYIQSVERTMLEEVNDKIYVTKKMNDTKYQQDRIVVKYTLSLSMVINQPRNRLRD